MTMHLPVTTPFAFELACLLVLVHFIGDFVLQSSWMASAKSRQAKMRDASGGLLWPYVLFAHASTHGFLVYLATGQIALAFAETFLHGVIDYAKTEGWIGLHRDQALHLACKAVWWTLVVWGLV